MENTTINKIDKSDLLRTSFIQEEVLTCTKEQLKRNIKLMKSLTLGNLYKQHVHIAFKNKEGKNLKTTATVWAVTESYVLLKGGMHIPIKSITYVDFH